MSEWKILRNGKLWHDRLDSEELAMEQVGEYIKIDSADYEVVQMTNKEIDMYQKG